MTCTETVSTLTPKHHLLYPDGMCHRIAAAICEQFEKNELQLKLLDMIPYIRQFQKKRSWFCARRPHLKHLRYDVKHPLVEKKYILQESCKILASQCIILARILQVYVILSRILEVYVILARFCKNLARNRLFGRILLGILFLQDTYKILQNSAKVMHYLSRFC